MMQDDLSRGNSALRDRMTARLRHAGLRPTRQRVELGCILFSKGHRHITAEPVYVSLWHLADIPPALTNVRSGGKADMTRTCRDVS